MDNLHIMPAVRGQAPHIARLIMMAMSDDCSRHFCGPRHTLDDFYHMMTHLVEMERSQYSYRNTLVAMIDGTLAGSLTCYRFRLFHSALGSLNETTVEKEILIPKKEAITEKAAVIAETEELEREINKLKK